MTQPLILASGSSIRARMLTDAGVPFSTNVPRVDEDSIRGALEADGASPRDIADALAEAKARKISGKSPGALVLGCDQVLDFDGRIFSKPQSPEEAHDQLTALRGHRHHLLSAAVIYEDGNPVWRHVGRVTLTMRQFSDAYLADYLARNFDSIRQSVGGYKLEEEGIRLFARVDGDYFTILGMPLFQVLTYLTVRGVLPE